MELQKLVPYPDEVIWLLELKTVGEEKEKRKVRDFSFDAFFNLGEI